MPSEQTDTVSSVGVETSTSPDQAPANTEANGAGDTKPAPAPGPAPESGDASVIPFNEGESLADYNKRISDLQAALPTVDESHVDSPEEPDGDEAEDAPKAAEAKPPADDDELAKAFGHAKGREEAIALGRAVQANDLGPQDAIHALNLGGEILDVTIGGNPVSPSLSNWLDELLPKFVAAGYVPKIKDPVPVLEYTGELPKSLQDLVSYNDLSEEDARLLMAARHAKRQTPAPAPAPGPTPAPAPAPSRPKRSEQDSRQDAATAQAGISAAFRSRGMDQSNKKLLASVSQKLPEILARNGFPSWDIVPPYMKGNVVAQALDALASEPAKPRPATPPSLPRGNKASRSDRAGDSTLKPGDIIPIRRDESVREYNERIFKAQKAS